MTACDQCAKPAPFLVHAAYSVAIEYDAHPRVAHYPGVMIRACAEHLAELLERDSDSFTATKQYLVNLACADKRAWRVAQNGES